MGERGNGRSIWALRTTGRSTGGRVQRRGNRRRKTHREGDVAAADDVGELRLCPVLPELERLLWVLVYRSGHGCEIDILVITKERTAKGATVRRQTPPTIPAHTPIPTTPHHNTPRPTHLGILPQHLLLLPKPVELALVMQRLPRRPTARTPAPAPAPALLWPEGPV